MVATLLPVLVACAGQDIPTTTLPELRPLRGAVEILAPGQLAADAAGRMVVADGQLLHLFDPDEQFLATVGRRGRGPGEYLEITALASPAGDSLLIWDASQRRLTWLDKASGRVAGTATLQAPLGHGSSRRGVLWTGGSRVRVAWAADLVNPHAATDTVVIAEHALDGSAPTVVAHVEKGGWKDYGSFLGPRSAFGPDAIVALGPDGTLAFGDGVDYCITLLGGDPESRPNRFCVPWQRAPLGRAREVLTDPGLTAELRSPEIAATLVRGQEYPSRRNSYDRLLVDDRGRVWVRVVDETHQYHPTYMAQLPQLRPPLFTWEVRDHSGTLAARFALPSRFTPRVAAGERVFGIFEEENGGETVRVATLPHGR